MVSDDWHAKMHNDSLLFFSFFFLSPTFLSLILTNYHYILSLLFPRRDFGWCQRRGKKM